MPPVSSIAGFAALSFALIVVPGPSVMFVVGRALALGRRAALLTVFGNALGVYVQVLLVAVGLGAVVGRSVLLFSSVKLLGAAYLVWLGVQSIRRRGELSLVADEPVEVASGRSVVGQGFVVGVSNPKAIVFFAAILPQFVDPAGAAAGLQMAFLGLVFVVVALISDASWGLAAGAARQWLGRSPTRLRRMSAMGGTAMIALGLQLAVTGRKD